jgi:hypothetical protein
MAVSPLSREFATTISRLEEYGSLRGSFAAASPRATAA